MAYLDHAASTPMRPAAIEAMLPWLQSNVGNPSGAHRPARLARRALDDARDRLAEVVGCHPDEVVFTSGGTEADNLAIAGVMANRSGLVVTSAIEHDAVLAAAARHRHRVVGVDRWGLVDLAAFADSLDADVALVSVMTVNNEIGTVQPLAQIAALLAERAPWARLHTDAVQALAWLDLTAAVAMADLVSLSAHKVGGPKGSGALIVRRGVELAAQVLGGGQERDRRSGTPNVAGAVAFAVAAAEAHAERAKTVARIGELRGRLEVAVANLDGVLNTVESFGPAPTVAGILHLCAAGLDSEALLFLLDEAGIAASAGSSCASGAQQRSHVLTALGIPAELARGALRLSLGWCSTIEDIDEAVIALAAAIAQLRGHAVAKRGEQQGEEAA